MNKLSLVLVLAILLAGSAVVTMSAPSYAQGYGGYNYPPPPQNPYATPWVGSNTPWTFYQGDWFLNGMLYQFFGNQYGWAPYYAYPSTYIVRPNNWYEPRWNAWYQQKPHYWQNFEQKHPYWRGHRAGRRYDQNFYNQYHRGHGGGWNQGFHGVRPPEATGPGFRGPGTPGPGVRPPEATGPGHPARATAPGVRPPEATGPGFHGPGTTGPGVRPPGAAGHGVRKPEAIGPGVRKPKTTTHDDGKKQQ